MRWAEDLVRLATACAGLSETPSLQERLSVCSSFGMDRRALERDLADIVEQRLAMWLLGDVASGLNYIERSEVVARRLERLSMNNPMNAEAHRALIDVVTRCQALILSNERTAKEGKAAIAEPIFTSLLIRQDYRCAICGVPLSSRVVRPCDRFKDGQEPIFATELDHATPYYLGGNIGNGQLLCKPCNGLKNDRIGVQEDGFVISGNHVRRRGRRHIDRRMAFWALFRQPRCGVSQCETGASGSLLWLSRVSTEAPWVYGNLAILCTDHAQAGSIWIHEDVSDQPT